MHSHLRHSSVFAPISAHTTEASYPHHITSSRPEKKQKMSITQTYRLAHRARGKLSSEASRGDHDLRLLVGHANLLDTLMLELQDAEREQEAWFEQTVSVAAAPEEPKRVQWSDNLVEQHRLEVPDASDDEEEEEDSDDEMETEPIQIPVPSRRRAISPPAHVRYTYQDEEEEELESDDEYDNLELALVRTRSHSVEDHEMAVPELVHDSDESDDESTPSSPEAEADEADLVTEHIIVQDFAAKRRPQQTQVSQPMEKDGFYLSQHTAPMVAAY